MALGDELRLRLVERLRVELGISYGDLRADDTRSLKTAYT